MPTTAATPRVVIAHDYLTQCGGAERVVLAMLDAFPGSRVVTTIYDPDATFPEFRDHEVETLWPDRFRSLQADPRRALPVLGRAVEKHRIDDADVVIASSSGWAHGFTTDAAKLVYCHNPARWLYLPEDYLGSVPPHARLALQALAPMLRRWDQRAAASATRYLANSTVVQRRIAKVYGRGSEVLHPPVAVDVDGDQEAVPGLDPGFLLTVSRPRGYKHAEVICEAMSDLPDTTLAVVGDLPEGADDWPCNVRALGRVSDAQLRWLYANAQALVGLSHEDFGLTPIEAYAFGTPSVLLRAGGYLDSSVEGLTTVFVDAVDAELVRRALVELQARTWDADAIRAHAQKFSLESFQRALQKHVRELSAPATPRPVPVATTGRSTVPAQPRERRRTAVAARSIAPVLTSTGASPRASAG